MVSSLEITLNYTYIIMLFKTIPRWYYIIHYLYTKNYYNLICDRLIKTTIEQLSLSRLSVLPLLTRLYFNYTSPSLYLLPIVMCVRIYYSSMNHEYLHNYLFRHTNYIFYSTSIWYCIRVSLRCSITHNTIVIYTTKLVYRIDLPKLLRGCGPEHHAWAPYYIRA